MTTKRTLPPNIYPRGDSPFLWMAFRDARANPKTGRRVRKLISAETDDPALAAQRQEARQKLADEEWGRRGSDDEGPLTFGRYRKGYIQRRRARDVATVDDDEDRLEHVAHRLDHMLLKDIKRPDIAAAIEELMNAPPETRKAPRTILHVYGQLRILFKEALRKGLILATPCTLSQKERELPKKRDKDRRWRKRSRYTKKEIRRLFTDERIPQWRRVLWTLLGLGALRVNEGTPLTWADYDRERKPLGALDIHKTYQVKKRRVKDGVKVEGSEREMPVHRTLAAVLAEWRLSGWPRYVGRLAAETDLIVPAPTPRKLARKQGAVLDALGQGPATADELAARLEALGQPDKLVRLRLRKLEAKGLVRRVGTRAGTTRPPMAWEAIPTQEPAASDGKRILNSNRTLELLYADLEMLGLRKRGQHSLRRTFISLARSEGARKDILRWATHGPEKDDILDEYTIPTWKSLCRQVKRLKFTLRPPGVLLQISATPLLRTNPTTEN